MNLFSKRSHVGAASYNSLLRTVLLLLLVAALPVFIWAVMTQRIELRKRAATSEPPVVCWNRVAGQAGNYSWPNGCGGNPNAGMCTQAMVPLSATETYNYLQWVNAGKPYIPGCMGTPTPTPAQQSINWRTPYAFLTANSMAITANGKVFRGIPDPGTVVSVHSDPGNTNYTTLEVTWKELGVEMRVFIYFAAREIQTVNGPSRVWYISEIRTYNGMTQGDWLYYSGGSINPQVIGTPFITADQTMHPNSGGIGELKFTTFRLQPFLNQTVTPSPTPTQLTCGGFAGTICPSGYTCRYPDGSIHPPYPDASGICRSNNPYPTFTPTPTPIPPGCYYRQVTCIQAPCNPILVCPTPTLTQQQLCVQHGGRCESLYVNCPTPDNQLPYNCGTGLRCIPAGMSCGPTPTPTTIYSSNPNPPLCTQSTIPPATGNAPLTVTLHGSGSAGSGPGFDGYQWDFENDGIWDTGVLINAIAHTYPAPGTFYPVYQVHGVNNVWSTKCRYPYPIVVSPISCTNARDGSSCSASSCETLDCSSGTCFARHTIGTTCTYTPGVCQSGRCTVTAASVCQNARNGSPCSYNFCPTMPPCPSGLACRQMMPACSAISGTCQNGQCIGSSSTTTPVPTRTPIPTCIPLPRCAIEGELNAQGVRVFCSIPNANYCPRPTIAQVPGDLNRDGRVNMFDYNILLTNYGKTGTPGFIPADIDKNGKVDIFDYNILLKYFQ